MKRPKKPSSSNNHHSGKLVPSSRDDVMLAAAVESRFLDLCGSFRRIKGADLIPPVELDPDILRWRQMRVRHNSGDYRHTEAELRSVKEVATWTVQANCVLRNQPPKHIVWKEEAGIETLADALGFEEN